MCGITGYYNYKSAATTSVSIINNMLVQLAHRGPDESGIYLCDQVVLGHTRLSIIDLDSGSQPMSILDGRYWITYNGEIFNYIELKDELITKGCKFKTKSDTEVILHAYNTYGVDCLSKFNGQFAFAIWDNSKRELFLARDRVGIRPLYYSSTADNFVFGSEIKSIIEHPDINVEISPDSLAEIFTFWSPLTPNTAFENIYEVPPGKYMKVNNYGAFIDSYWNLSYPKAGYYNNISLSKAIDEFEFLFTDAIKLRLRADVAVGAYLSGGIDSSITTYYINKLFPAQLKTFSIEFEDAEYDESDYQRLAVQSIKTEHSSVKCGIDDIAEVFPRVIWHAETPLLRTAPAPMFLLSEHVKKQNYKVVVTGEGADEVLAGYNVFKEMQIRRFWAKNPQSSIRPILLNKLYPYLSHLKKQNTNLLKIFFGYKLTETNSPYYSHLLRWNNTSRIKNYFSASFKNDIKATNPLDRLSEVLPASFLDVDDLAKAQWLETSIFMSGYLLSSQGDRMAMANSIEGRYPFLDYRIIEFCANLPPDFKLDGLKEKKLLKKMMGGKLPDRIVNRSKQAYRAPSMMSMLEGKQKYLHDAISDDQLKKTGIFEPALIKGLIKKISKGNQFSDVDNMALTGIISTQLLYNQFVNKKMRPKKKLGLTNMKIIDVRNHANTGTKENILS